MSQARVKWKKILAWEEGDEYIEIYESTDGRWVRECIDGNCREYEAIVWEEEEEE